MRIKCHSSSDSHAHYSIQLNIVNKEERSNRLEVRAPQKCKVNFTESSAKAHSSHYIHPLSVQTGRQEAFQYTSSLCQHSSVKAIHMLLCMWQTCVSRWSVGSDLKKTNKIITLSLQRPEALIMNDCVIPMHCKKTLILFIQGNVNRKRRS